VVKYFMYLKLIRGESGGGEGGGYQIVSMPTVTGFFVITSFRFGAGYETFLVSKRRALSSSALEEQHRLCSDSWQLSL
jgi:hypothetical protein